MQTLLERADDAILGIRKPQLDALVASLDAAVEPLWLPALLELERLCAQRNASPARTLFASLQAAPHSQWPIALKYRAVTGWAQFLAEASETDEALQLLQDLDANTIPNPGYKARALRTLALCATQQGRYDDAQELAEQALALYETLPYPAPLGNALSELSTIFSRKGQLANAVRMQFRAYETFTAMGNPIATAIALLNLGVMYGETGNRDVARTYFEQVRTIDTADDAERFATYAALNIGLMHLEDGHAEQAATELLVAEQLSTSNNQWAMATGARRGLAAAYRMLGDLAAAQQWLLQADHALALAPNEPQRITHVIEEARLALALGNVDTSIELLEPLVDSARARDDVSTLLRCLAELHGAYSATNKPQQAYQALLERTRLEANVTNTAAQQQLALFTVERERDEERRTAQRERALLHSVMPGSIADRILAGERRIADVHQHVSILFADLVGFTTMAQHLEPQQVLDLIERLFAQFDAVVEQHGLVRIKTIGDAYMAVANLPEPINQPTAQAARCALAMMHAVAHDSSGLQVRLGLHTGPVVAGVIGANRPMYDVWGDTVNVASRMESSSEPGRIHISEAFANALAGAPFSIVERGTVNIKGKGDMTTYWLEGQ